MSTVLPAAAWTAVSNVSLSLPPGQDTVPVSVCLPDPVFAPTVVVTVKTFTAPCGSTLVVLQLGVCDLVAADELAQVHVPGPLVFTMIPGSSPAGSVSLTVVVPFVGPLLLSTVSVYETGAPGATGPAVPDLSTSRATPQFATQMSFDLPMLLPPEFVV